MNETVATERADRAAHALRPFSALLSSAIGVALGTAAHAYGWPVAEGGSSGSAPR